MKSFGEIRNEVGALDTDVMMARKLAILTGKPPEILMNWETADETKRWEVAFWVADLGNWELIHDESVFGALWLALLECGMDKDELQTAVEENFEDQKTKMQAYYGDRAQRRRERRQRREEGTNDS